MKVHELFDPNDNNYVNTNKLVKGQGNQVKKLDDVIDGKLDTYGGIFNGVYRASDNYFNVLAIKTDARSSNKGIKIKTNLTSLVPMYIFEIKGISYSKGEPFYFMIPTYSGHKVLSLGNYKPDVKVGVEDGKVVLYLGIKTPYNMLYVNVYNTSMGHGHTIQQPIENFIGWSVEYEDISPDATNVRTIPYL